MSDTPEARTTNPHVIAASLAEKHGISPDFDHSAESHRQVQDLIQVELGRLSCGELGELICTDQDDAMAPEFAHDLHLTADTNFRGLLEHTAGYIIDMVMCAQLNRK